MFVCNKWDVVKKRETDKRGTEEEVRELTFKNLQRHFPDIRRENIFEISVSQVCIYVMLCLYCFKPINENVFVYYVVGR